MCTGTENVTQMGRGNVKAPLQNVLQVISSADQKESHRRLLKAVSCILWSLKTFSTTCDNGKKCWAECNIGCVVSGNVWENCWRWIVGARATPSETSLVVKGQGETSSIFIDQKRCTQVNCLAWWEGFSFGLPQKRYHSADHSLCSWTLL